jgi:hypothetical protein
LFAEPVVPDAVVLWFVVIGVVSAGFATHDCVLVIVVLPPTRVHVVVCIPVASHVDQDPHCNEVPPDELPPPLLPPLDCAGAGVGAAFTVYDANDVTTLPAKSVAVHVAVFAPDVEVSIPVMTVSGLGPKVSVAAHAPVIASPIFTLVADNANEFMIGAVLIVVGDSTSPDASTA